MATRETRRGGGDLELEDEGATAFTHTIIEAEDGQLHADLTRSQFTLLRDMRELVKKKGKVKAKLILTLNYESSDGLSRETPSLTSVLDYHPKGPASSLDAARFGQHRGQYFFPLSDEWKSWNEKDGEDMSQSQFARFMEDRLPEVLDPADALGSALDWKERLRVDYASPSTMLELSRGLAVRQNSEVRNEHNLNAGTAQIFFATSHVDTNGQPLDIPAAVLLAMPVFKRGDLYQVPCRLRYRVDGPRVIWRYELARLDAVFEHAFAEALDLVRTGRPSVDYKPAIDGTGLPVLRGSPEVAGNAPQSL